MHDVNDCCPQYVGLPYMTDPVHPDDTLFLVAEADFRSYKADCLCEHANLDMEQAAERARVSAAQERAFQVPPETDAQDISGPSVAGATASTPREEAQAAADAVEWQQHVHPRKGLGWSGHHTK